jgi:4-aminobutyrate aminotransferase-like enzyme/Ser/Thr protein kinase RdoA (MazF antagonist)
MTPSIKHIDRNVPQIDESVVKSAAREYFSLDGEFHSLPSERDQNFDVRCDDGRRFVMRIANIDDEENVIDLQVSALRHLAEMNPSLPVPRVLLNSRGQPLSKITFGDNSTHFVHVLSYLDGLPLDAVEGNISKKTFHNVGKAIAHVDLALRGFFHRAAQHDHPWNMATCSRLLSLVEHLDNPESRKVVINVFNRMDQIVLPRIRKLRHQVIHQDAHGGNVLVDPHDPTRIAGLSDFGVILYGSLVAEVGIAADVAAHKSDDPIEIMCETTAGFDSVLPMEDEEIDLIFDMIVARNAMTATVGSARAALTSDDDEHAHISVPQHYIDNVDRLLTIGRDTATRRLRRACRFPVHCPTTADEAWSIADEDKLIGTRDRHLGKNATHFYERPLHFERASGAYLHGADGHRYLDCYNNVPQVGHCNAHVVKAISRQAAALNTNTRYLYSSALEYAERLTNKLAPHLDACVFVNSGSEANDFAWQIAKFTTGRRGGLLMEDGYHGITESILSFSPCKASVELPDYLEGLVVPDPYRGAYREDTPDIAERYAEDADRAIRELNTRGHDLAAFMIDSAFCSSGVPNVPEGYLQGVEKRVRAAGGLMICDEVQSGFGRMGQWWGHEHHGVRADIVTMGKPVANGHPLGVVVTTSEILNAFIDSVAPFSTFGGNTVACAAGNAVLDVIERDELIQHGVKVGDYLRDQLRQLADSQALIGDVRGFGMLTGLEFVTDRSSRSPATKETRMLLELMREKRILVGEEGRDSNILKLRPPLVLKKKHVDKLIDGLDVCLSRLSAG